MTSPLPTLKETARKHPVRVVGNSLFSESVHKFRGNSIKMPWKLPWKHRRKVFPTRRAPDYSWKSLSASPCENGACSGEPPNVASRGTCPQSFIETRKRPGMFPEKRELEIPCVGGRSLSNVNFSYEETHVESARKVAKAAKA